MHEYRVDPMDTQNTDISDAFTVALRTSNFGLLPEQTNLAQTLADGIAPVRALAVPHFEDADEVDACVDRRDGR